LAALPIALGASPAPGSTLIEPHVIPIATCRWRHFRPNSWSDLFKIRPPRALFGQPPFTKDVAQNLSHATHCLDWPKWLLVGSPFWPNFGKLHFWPSNFCFLILPLFLKSPQLLVISNKSLKTKSFTSLLGNFYKNDVLNPPVNFEKLHFGPILRLAVNLLVSS